MLSMKELLVPDTLTRLINHNLPVQQQSKHFVRYCQRLLSSKFVTSLQNNDWQNLTRDLPLGLLDKLDSGTHFSIIYFLISISKKSGTSRGFIKDQNVPEKPEESKLTKLLNTPVLNDGSGDLLSAVLFSFIGIDSSQISHHVSANEFKVSNLSQNQPVRELIKNLLQVSFLYGSVSRFAREDGIIGGIVAQSFCSEIREQLNDYYRYIVV